MWRCIVVVKGLNSYGRIAAASQAAFCPTLFYGLCEEIMKDPPLAAKPTYALSSGIIRN